MTKVSSCDNLKIFYSHYHKTYEQSNWQGTNLWEEIQHANTKATNFLLRLRVMQKALQLPLYFFLFSFSSVFLERLVTSVYLCYPRHVWVVPGFFHYSTPKSNLITYITLAVFWDACGSWRAMRFSLLLITIIHNIKKEQETVNSQTK